MTRADRPIPFTFRSGSNAKAGAPAFEERRPATAPERGAPKSVDQRLPARGRRSSAPAVAPAWTKLGSRKPRGDSRREPITIRARQIGAFTPITAAGRSSGRHFALLSRFLRGRRPEFEQIRANVVYEHIDVGFGKVGRRALRMMSFEGVRRARNGSYWLFGSEMRSGRSERSLRRKARRPFKIRSANPLRLSSGR
jgi:hypothetical protein